MKYSEKDIEFANQILTRRNELDNGLVEAWMSDPEHLEMLREFVAIREEYTNWNCICGMIPIGLLNKNFLNMLI